MSKQSKISLQKLLSYKASIELELLGHLVSYETFDKIAPTKEVDEASDEHTETTVKSIIEKTYDSSQR